MSEDPIILPYKGKVIEGPAFVYAPYIPEGFNMKIEIRYDRGNPAGYTDDLGIIADRNQWVKARLPGWYTWIHHSQAMEVHNWCDQNLQGYWKLASGIPKRELYIHDEKDVTLFSLRWS